MSPCPASTRSVMKLSFFPCYDSAAESPSDKQDVSPAKLSIEKDHFDSYVFIPFTLKYTLQTILSFWRGVLIVSSEVKQWRRLNKNFMSFSSDFDPCFIVFLIFWAIKRLIRWWVIKLKKESSCSSLHLWALVFSDVSCRKLVGSDQRGRTTVCYMFGFRLRSASWLKNILSSWFSLHCISCHAFCILSFEYQHTCCLDYLIEMAVSLSAVHAEVCLSSEVKTTLF